MKVKLLRFICVLHISLLFCMNSVAANDTSLHITFIGNAAFKLSDGAHTVFVDFPYKSGAYGYMKYDYFFPGEEGDILSLITHRHEDHFEPFLFERQERWKIIGPKEITLALSQRKVIDFSDEITYGPIKVFPKKSKHANTEHYSYLLTWNGQKLFFTGDTEDTEILKNLPELDALFITPWFYRKAMLNKTMPETKKVIIHHHKEKEIILNCKDCVIPLQYQKIEIR